MWPEPLHAALVHFPIALACLAPLAAGAAALAIRRGAVSPSFWRAVVVLLVLLAGSAWWATETGEGDEDRVEEVVQERFIEAHEEAGERLLAVSAIAMALAGAGLLPGRLGARARVVALVATLVLPAAALQTGHTGGALVYQHGAASVYAADSRGDPTGGQRGER